jgi:Ran GTPase-activating protein (RanGAP) involved in mRNA processing and transport
MLKGLHLTDDFDINKMKEMINSEQTIDLTEKNIGDDGLRKLMPLLIESKLLHSLELCGNKLSDQSCLYLLDILHGNESIKVLKLEWNMFTHAGVRILCEYLINENNKNIKYLELYGNSLIGTKGAECLAYMLSKNTSLTHLGLSNCGLKEEGLYALASVLYHGHNTTLKTFNIYNNGGIEAEDIEKVIEACINRNKGLSIDQSEFPADVIRKLPILDELRQAFETCPKEPVKRRSLKDRLSWKLSQNGYDLSSICDQATSTTEERRRSSKRGSGLFRIFGSENEANISDRLQKLETENKELKEKLQMMESMLSSIQAHLADGSLIRKNN